MKSVLRKDDIQTDVQPNISVQDYSGQIMIEGVEMKELRYFTDDGGYFLELNRWNQSVMQDFPDFEVKQMNYSQMDPSVVKAWHLHFQQEDIWFIPPTHKLLVILRDCRKDSPTAGALMRLVMGAGKARLLYIPRGVAHGAANLWQQHATIIYFVNNQFDPNPDTTDEKRLPWDAFGKDIWELAKG